MGMNMGIGSFGDGCFKRKYRWLMYIDGISDDGVSALPPSKSSRPGLTFKEMTAEHVTETIYFPSKPDWKPVQLTLYDLVKNKHPIMEWLKGIYDPNGNGPGSPNSNGSGGGNGKWTPSGENNFKKNIHLVLYNGCGDIIEEWKFENAYPQIIEFGELDMGSNDVVTVDVTLRYDRAYIINTNS